MGSGGRRPDETLRWLAGEPSLEDLRRAYPAEWGVVARRLARAVADGPTGLKAEIARANDPGMSTPDHRRRRPEVIRAQVQRQMLLQAVKRASFEAAVGVPASEVRLGAVDGRLVQRLLFRRGLERKAVSYRAFRLVWPFIGQRRVVMPLVRDRGIYCFYSDALLNGIARLVDGRDCLEIAAGDGTLTRLLRERGVDVVATDDHSWGRSITYPEHVVRQDARAALAARAPRAVLCSFPPTDNAFERFVFETPSVELYIVVGSKRETGSGAWDTYRRQTEFAMAHDASLGRLVLPPEQGNAVLVFRRRD